jgi:hypothetical protein
VEGLRSTSGSVTVLRTTTPVEVRLASHASSVGGSCVRTTRSVSSVPPPPSPPCGSEFATEHEARRAIDAIPAATAAALVPLRRREESFIGFLLGRDG